MHEVLIWKPGAEWDGLSLQQPFKRRWWSPFFYCPLCNQRFLDSRWRVLTYTMHYSGHLDVPVFRSF